MRLLIKVSVKQGLTEKEFAEMMAEFPAQDVSDKKLIKQGIQEGPPLVAADRSGAWAVFNCESQDKAQEILQTTPVYKFCEYSFTPLLNEEDNVPR